MAFAVLIALAANSPGQERNYAPSNPGARSLFQKVESLQRGVKQRLKSALGVKPKETEAVARETRPQLKDAQSTDARWQTSRPDGRVEVTRSEAPPAMGQPVSQRRSTYQAESQPRAEFPPPRYPVDTADLRSQLQANRAAYRVEPPQPNPYADPNHVPSTQPVEYRQNEYRQSDDPRPVPAAPQDGYSARPQTNMPAMAQPIQRWDGQPAAAAPQPYGRAASGPVGSPSQAYPPGPGYSSGPTTAPQQAPGTATGYGDSTLHAGGPNGRAPLPRGSILGDSQITATQHALRLIEENGDLKAKLAMIEAENQRLKDKLVQSENLLARSTQAVEEAHQEIDAMASANSELQKKLSDSEQQYNRYLMQTDRMLQSIREELDDVLVREISAKGN